MNRWRASRARLEQPSNATQDLAPGSGQSVTATGSLKMNDLSTSQDACKGVNLLLNFTS